MLNTASLKTGMRTQTFIRDAALALVGAAISAAAVTHMHFPIESAVTELGAVTWAVLLWLPLAWRRITPAASALLVAIVAVGTLATGYPLLVPAHISVLVALYSVAAYGPKWAARLALGVAVAGALAMGYSLAHRSQGQIVAGSQIYDFAVIGVFASALVIAAWALGLMRRARGETMRALKSRAAALEDRAQQLELERDQQRIIATQAERARIAREMHDIVAHSLSIMIVQADGGRYLAAAGPAKAGEVLGTISETGRAALKEMRRLLGVLRSDDEAAAGPVMAPLPASVQGKQVGAAVANAAVASGASLSDTGVSDANVNVASASGVTVNTGSIPMLNSGLFPPALEDLFAQARAAGMPLKVSTTGTMRELEPSAALTLQRVCQESLTNIRKHAGLGAKATVELVWLPNSVELTVSDNGQGSANGVNDPGFGLIGLGERATLVGGTLESGPKPAGGWQTKFTMPISVG